MDYNKMKTIIKESAAPFLTANKGMWIGADGIEISFDTMDKGYKENCYNYLKRDKYTIETGGFINSRQLTPNESEELVSFAMTLYYEKLAELEMELEKL